MPRRQTRSLQTSSTRSSLTPSTSSSISSSSSLSSTRSTTPTPTPRESTPSSDPTPSHSPISTSLLKSTLRKRSIHPHPHSPSPSRARHVCPSETEEDDDESIDTTASRTKEENKIPADMFSSRKYTPLPTTANGTQPPIRKSKRAGGGLSTWKRWALIGAGITLVLFIGYSSIPRSRSDHRYYESENTETETYTPGIDSKPQQDVDETDYSSPPFRPDTSPLGGDEDEDDTVSIQPIGDLNEHVHENPDDDTILEYPHPSEGGSSSPHDTFGDEAKGAHEAEPDYSDIDDDYEGTMDGMPSSFEDDRDAENTISCSKPYSPSKPIVQYALTIDAGSTGSRIHVYKFNNCGPSPALEYETFKSINPGLSAYAKDPSAAAASLDPLLDEAERVVPNSLWSCTPVEVKATAGLRLLGHEQSEAILEEVRNRLESNYRFVVGGESSVMVMDGKDEGVYAWITANYLLGKIGEGAKSSETLAVMDLGGASTQIVFEPKFQAKSGALLDGEHKYSLNFGGQEFTLYQHSYLGYGLMRARRSIHNLIAFTYSFGRSDLDWDELDEEIMVPNPCLSRGSTRRVELDPPGRKAVNVTMHGGNGGFEACNRFVELVMAKDAICEVKPCSFDGVYQPSLLDTFPKGQLLALSYFTDRIKPLLKSTSSHIISISDLTSMAKDVCDGPTSWKKKWGSNPTALAELEDRPEYCLDLTFMNALLGLGYELSPERQLMVEKKLKGVELGWALGAGLALVQNAKLTCTA